jgi:hypothetical protein
VATKSSTKIPEMPFDADQVSQVLREFVDASNVGAEASVDETVRVRVGAAMNLLSVEILESTLDQALKQRLETAIVGAVNIAMQKAVIAAGSALRARTPRRTEEAAMSLGGGVGIIGTVHVETAKDFIKLHYDWAREHQITGAVGVQARIGFLLTESRPAAFGAQVTEMEPVVTIATGDLYLSEFGQLSGDGERQTINASRAVISTDSVHLVLNSSDGLGTLQVPLEVKVFDLNHCVLIGSRNRGILGEITPVSRGEVMTLMLWGKEAIVGVR